MRDRVAGRRNDGLLHAFLTDTEKKLKSCEICYNTHTHTGWNFSNCIQSKVAISNWREYLFAHAHNQITANDILLTLCVCSCVCGGGGCKFCSEVNECLELSKMFHCAMCAARAARI